MTQVIDQNTYTPQYDPHSIVDFLKSSGQASDIGSRGKLFVSTFGNSGGKYIGSPAQNMALLAKLRGAGGTTNPKTISGSSSVSQGQQTNHALITASGSVTPPGTNPNVTPAPPVPPAQGPSVLDTQIQTITDQSNTELQQLEAPYTESLKILQDQQKDAISAARDTWRRSTGGAQVAGEEDYVGKVSQHYQEQMDNLTNQYVGEQQTILSNKATSIANAKATYQSNQDSQFKDYLAGIKEGDGTMPPANELMDAIGTAMGAGKTFEQAKSEVMGALEYAKRVQTKADIQDKHMEELISKLATKGDEKVLSITDIEKFKTDYPNIADKINYGMTSSDAIKAIQFQPKEKLENLSPVNTSEAADVGLDTDKFGEISNFLSQGWTLDDIIKSNPGVINSAQEKFIRKFIKPIE